MITIILAALALLATGIDWLQTIYIALHPAQFYERNPILGLHPTVRQVNAYFMVCFVLALAFSALCYYTDMRGLLLAAAMVLLLVEVYWIVSNHQLGIRLGWMA